MVDAFLAPQTFRCRSMVRTAVFGTAYEGSNPSTGAMKIKTAITENSIWKFDMELMRYVRFPRSECPDVATIIPYTNEWDEFTKVERMLDGTLMVHRPVPFGTGAFRNTSLVLEDDLDI